MPAMRFLCTLAALAAAPLLSLTSVVTRLSSFCAGQTEKLNSTSMDDEVMDIMLLLLW